MALWYTDSKALSVFKIFQYPLIQGKSSEKTGKAKSLSFKSYEANLQKRWIFRITSRSSRSEVFLEISQNLQENTYARVSFLI